MHQQTQIMHIEMCVISIPVAWNNRFQQGCCIQQPSQIRKKPVRAFIIMQTASMSINNMTHAKIQCVDSGSITQIYHLFICFLSRFQAALPQHCNKIHASEPLCRLTVFYYLSAITQPYDVSNMEHRYVRIVWINKTLPC